jgi:hypothetical protein
MLLLRRLRSPDFPTQHFLRHDPLCRIRIATSGVDGVQADVEDVPAAQAPALFRERAQIGPHPLGVGKMEGQQLPTHCGVGKAELGVALHRREMEVERSYLRRVRNHPDLKLLRSSWRGTE